MHQKASERAKETSFYSVHSEVSCVMTRFRLRSCLSLPGFFLAFRSLRKEALKTIPGLLKAVLLLESPHVCYTLSVWANDDAILQFNHLHSHVRVANWSIPLAYRPERHRAEIWSVHWKLRGVSHNLNWDELDLTTFLSYEVKAPTAAPSPLDL